MLILLTALAFVLTLMVVLSGYLAAASESPIEARLSRFIPKPEPVARPGRGQRLRAAMQTLLAAVGRYGFVTGDRTLAQTLSAAGFRATNAASLFLGVRTLVSFGPAVLVLAARTAMGQRLGSTLLWAFLVCVCGHVFANTWVARRARRRIRQITVALPDALDLMVVSLESGLGLNATISRVGEERANMNDPLGLEFAQAAIELRTGRSREDALRALGERNGVDDMKSLAALIVQSDKLGASMAHTLRVHADMLRTKRRQRAEEEARKLPVKVLFPLAFFILPALLVVATGPAFLRFAGFVVMLQDRRVQQK
jgi:tight adherence protein C